MQRLQPERVLRNLVIDWFTYQPNCMVWVNASRGVYSQKLKRYFTMVGKGHRKGVPDLLGIWHGKPLAIELKAAGGRASKEQLDFIEEFSRNGGIAFISNSLEDVIRELKARST